MSSALPCQTLPAVGVKGISPRGSSRGLAWIGLVLAFATSLALQAADLNGLVAPEKPTAIAVSAETARELPAPARSSPEAHGSAYGMIAAVRGYQHPLGEWNFQEIEVQGQKIKVTLNGTKILDVDISTFDRSQIATVPKGLDRTKGLIGFAGHNDPVEFRSFKVKKM